MSSFTVIHQHFYLQCSSVFLLVCYGYLALFEYILRIKILKMRKWERFQSFLERAKFYAEWNNYSYTVRNGIFWSHSPKGISFSWQGVNIRVLAKVLILTTGIFSAWSLKKFFNFFKPEYFIPGVFEKGSDLYFRYFDANWIYFKNQN